MKEENTITINIQLVGHSDDIFIVRCDTPQIIDDSEKLAEEYPLPSSGKVYVSIALPNGEGVMISAEYAIGCGNTWHIGISALEEELPLSSLWGFTVMPSSGGYCNNLSVTAPKGVKIQRMIIASS